MFISDVWSWDNFIQAISICQEKVAKISGFNCLVANFYVLRGVNPEILAYARGSGIFLRYRLSETAPTPMYAECLREGQIANAF